MPTLYLVITLVGSLLGLFVVPRVGLAAVALATAAVSAAEWVGVFDGAQAGETISRGNRVVLLAVAVGGLLLVGWVCGRAIGYAFERERR